MFDLTGLDLKEIKEKLRLMSHLQFSPA